MERDPRRPHLIRVAAHTPYTVTVGAGVLASLAEYVDEARVALVSDETVNALHGDVARGSLERSGARVTSYTIPAGERSKSLEQWGRLLRAMAADGFDRSAAVVALGGGVVGDLAGFVAASYMRGVALYQVPTSLLAMVDASVGGKTAVNLPEGKNLVGAFWQPRAVLADVETLRTLPPQQFRQGAVELFKHGLLADPALLARFDDGLSAGSPPAVLADAVARSVAVKAEVVAGDEREAGARAYLNLGHTLAHALEAVSDHALGHGDAVAYGLAYAALLARARGWADLMPRVRRLLAWLEPAPLPAADFAALEPYLDRDKKAAAGRRRFVLLEDVGRPRLVDDVPHTAQVEAWSRLREIPEVAA